LLLDLVSRLIAEPYASASVSVDDLKKDLGVVIADIGGGTTDGIIFKGGQPIRVFTINIGGKIFTNDLSIGLGISFDEAERIKVILGLKSHENHHAIKIKDIHGSLITINNQYAHEILKARTVELGRLILNEIEATHTYLGSGVYLTGGGSEISGIENVIFKNNNVRIEKAKPQIPFHNILPITQTKPEQNQNSYVLASKFATVAGLLYLDLLHRHNLIGMNKSWKINKYLQYFVAWVRELS